MNKHILHQKRLAPGFTLIEMVITLAVIAIVAALASPAFLAMAPDMQLRSAAMDLYANVRDAKILAIKDNRSMTITFGTAGYTIGEPFTDNDGDGLFDAGAGDVFTVATDDRNGDGVHTAEKVLVYADEYEYNVKPGSGSTATNWSGGACTQAPSITFNSRGTAQTASVYIDYVLNTTPPTNSTICYAVTTRVAGAIKMRKFNGTSWIE